MIVHFQFSAMGKSFKKTPIFGLEAESDKPAKTQVNKALRRAVHVKLHTLPIEEDPDVILPSIKEISDNTTLPKGSKVYQDVLIKQQTTKYDNRRDKEINSEEKIRTFRARSKGANRGDDASPYRVNSIS